MQLLQKIDTCIYTHTYINVIKLNSNDFYIKTKHKLFNFSKFIKLKFIKLNDFGLYTSCYNFKSIYFKNFHYNKIIINDVVFLTHMIRLHYQIVKLRVLK